MRFPRFRIGLRGLMVVVLLVGILFGAVVVPARRQRDAVAAIERSGGDVTYDFDPGVTGLQLSAWQDWVARRLGPDFIGQPHAVALWDVSAGDADRMMEHIALFERLKGLLLKNVAVSDAGLLRLRGLSRLEDLRIEKTAVEGPGLAALEGMVNLEVLGLDDVPIADEDVAKLSRLPKLWWISLSGPRLTNAGLVHLGRSQSLGMLA